MADAIDVPEHEMQGDEANSSAEVKTSAEGREKEAATENGGNGGFAYHSPILDVLTTSASYLGTALQVRGVLSAVLCSCVLLSSPCQYQCPLQLLCQFLSLLSVAPVDFSVLNLASLLLLHTRVSPLLLFIAFVLSL